MAKKKGNEKVFTEWFMREYPDLYEMEAVLKNFSEADFKRFFQKVESQEYEWKDLNISLPLKPIEKSRPRGGANGVYDPDESVKKYYVRVLQFLLAEEMEALDIDEYIIKKDEVINMSITYYKEIAQGTANVNKLMAITNESPLIINPDIDNYDKFIYDVFQLAGIVENDSGIVKHNNEKRFSLCPRVEINIRYRVKKV